MRASGGCGTEGFPFRVEAIHLKAPDLQTPCSRIFDTAYQHLQHRIFDTAYQHLAAEDI